jgi:hypothetical protein
MFPLALLMIVISLHPVVKEFVFYEKRWCQPCGVCDIKRAICRKLEKKITVRRRI